MLTRLMLLGAFASQLDVCGPTVISTKPLQELASSWDLSAQLFTATCEGARACSAEVLTFDSQPVAAAP